jgi:hypothetical protein
VSLEGRLVADPDGGGFWVMVQKNWLSGQAADQLDLTVAVVPGDDAGYRSGGPAMQQHRRGGPVSALSKCYQKNSR